MHTPPFVWGQKIAALTNVKVEKKFASLRRPSFIFMGDTKGVTSNIKKVNG